jgi:hypothetical protein
MIVVVVVVVRRQITFQAFYRNACFACVVQEQTETSEVFYIMSANEVLKLLNEYILH